jgi:hypothetical protein
MLPPPPCGVRRNRHAVLLHHPPVRGIPELPRRLAWGVKWVSRCSVLFCPAIDVSHKRSRLAEVGVCLGMTIPQLVQPVLNHAGGCVKAEMRGKTTTRVCP